MQRLSSEDDREFVKVYYELELAQCPFCGGAPIQYVLADPWNGYITNFYIECEGCRTHMELKENSYEPITCSTEPNAPHPDMVILADRWNTRKEPSKC